MFRTGLSVILGVSLTASAFAQVELGKIVRPPRKEPAYKSKAPKYGLLTFGPEAANQVWLVVDGDTLYVDRNGDGDLSEVDENVAAKLDKARDPAEYGYSFDFGDLRVGGKVHKSLQVGTVPLARYAAFPTFKAYGPLQAVLKTDPNAMAMFVTLDVESARLKGGGIGGRLSYLVDFYDLEGILQFADRPAAAPVIHFDGPLQVTFCGERPTLRLGRENDVVLAVGTQGRGPGTLAMLQYEQTIPDKACPIVDILFPAARNKAPLKEHYELRLRC